MSAYLGLSSQTEDLNTVKHPLVRVGLWGIRYTGGLYIGYILYLNAENLGIRYITGLHINNFGCKVYYIPFNFRYIFVYFGYFFSGILVCHSLSPEVP